MTASETPAPVAIVMISLNEAHNMNEVLENLVGFAQEIHLVDSFSIDGTVDMALAHGVHVVQRKFRGFGDQWNFAMRELPITAPWTMKLDPDERLTPALKASLREAMSRGDADGLIIRRRLWFMGGVLPIRQDVLRVWRTGACRFSDVLANEQPMVEGRHVTLVGDLEHHDSPNLHHWAEKQNNYTTAEAYARWRGDAAPYAGRLFGTARERTMWLRGVYFHLPFRFLLMWLYCLVWKGAWRAGRTGRIWARLRTEIFRLWQFKYEEMRRSGVGYSTPAGRTGPPHPAARQCDEG